MAPRLKAWAIRPGTWNVGDEQRREFLGIIKKECRRLNRLLQ
jgi:hypothetical protein